MKIHAITALIIIFVCFTLGGCGGEDLTFQQLQPEPKVRLFRIFDNTPAIKSMFENIKQEELNERMNELMNANPELAAQLYLALANIMYGYHAPLPEMVKSLARGLNSFHAEYSRDPEALDAVVEVVKEILKVDPDVMMESVDALIDVVKKLRNWEDANRNGIIDPGECTFYWDFFSPYQELSDMGYNGINRLIENLEFVHTLYDGAEDLDDPASLLQNAMQTVVDENMDVEAKIADAIDFLENPLPGESVRDIEEDIADWMIADPVKKSIADYLIGDLYPIIKNPVLENAHIPQDFNTLQLPEYLKEYGQNSERYFKNFVRRGRWIIEEQMKILSATPKGLSVGGNVASSDETLLTQWLVDAFQKDVQKWDDLESVAIFDFTNNELLKWIGSNDPSDGYLSIGERLTKALKLSSDVGIDRETLRKLLWSGISYTSTNGVTKNFKGLLYSTAPYPNDPNHPANWVIHPSDGYITQMAKYKSTDAVQKPFRIQAQQRLGGKAVNPNYSGESQIESILTNMQLHILQDYYCNGCKKDKNGNPIYKWALTPEDGQEYFGDPNRNIQTLLGGITQSIRNLVMFDKYGSKTGSISALAELLYVMAASYGVVDPVNAPGELSVQNCMRSMGSPLGNSTYIETCMMGICVQIPVIGANDIYRKSIHGSNWVRYATQHGMPANELLQPGTFRRREGLSTVGEWHGKFSAHQGDIIGSADASGRMITTNWNMSEIALAAWEGYGPYTYRGKAPNGGKCKYENDFYSDWYHIKQASFGWPEPNNGDKGPGVGEFQWTYGRYHMYETIYVPSKGQPGFVESDYDSSRPKYGYLRKTSTYPYWHFTGGAYVTPGVHFSVDPSDANDVSNGGNRITIDCRSREEAIRKNIYWLLYQKKYLYVIPIHAAKRIGWGFIKADIEIFAYNLIIANGIAGIANAKRFGNDIKHNAIWGSNLETNLGGDKYYLDLVDEGNNTARLDGVSFLDGDYCVILDYRYYNKGMLSWLIEFLVKMTNEIWNSLGGGPVLPAVVGSNLQVMLTMCNSVYHMTDILLPGWGPTEPYMQKFLKFYQEYYPELDFWNTKECDLPPVPKVKGVSYPVAFDPNTGKATAWQVWTGDSKGKFDDFLTVLAMIVGTIHEDGKVCVDWNGNAATASQIDEGNFTYFARDGYRAQLDNFILSTVALNQTKFNAQDGKSPVYNSDAIVNILIDHNPINDIVEPGSRKGILPALLNSKYTNINYLTPIKNSISLAIRHIIRSYLNSFALSTGPTGNMVPYWVNGQRNPDIDWNVPIYRLLFFADNQSLDQLRRTLDFIRDLSQDERFVQFLKKSIPVINNYLYVKWLEENWGTNFVGARPTPEEAEELGLFQLHIDEGDIDTAVNFLRDFNYGDFISFIQENRINDFEGLYNFDLDTWGGELTPGELEEKLGDLNSNLVRYFGVNLLEGAILGVYEIKEEVRLSHLRALNEGEEDIVVFNAGDICYGHGKYMEFDPEKDGNKNGIIELTVQKLWDGSGIVNGGADWDGETSIVQSKEKYYKYLDVKQWLSNPSNASKYRTIFKGLNSYIDFRYHANNEAFSDYCLSYRTIWFRGGEEYVPNIYNLHNYDLRMDWLMDEYNKNLIVFTSTDFEYGKPLKAYEDPIGKTNSIVWRPATVIDWLYGWNGTSNQGLNIPNELNFAKNAAIDHFFDNTTFIVPDPRADFKEDYEATPREIVQDYRQYLFDEIINYEYMPGKREAYYPVTANKDLEDGHRHAINNITEAFATLLSPVKRDNPTEANPVFVIGRLFEAWERFVEVANINPDDLKKVQEAVGHLLWDFNGNRSGDMRNLDHLVNGYYTHIASDVLDKLSPVLRAFQGMYAELTEMGIIAFGERGIGRYLLDVMEPAPQYDAWDLVEEFNYLINTDVFQTAMGHDSFWWHAGNLLEDLAIMLLQREERNGPSISFDYYGAVRGIFY
ncbi:MAG: hypothetical protein N2316_08310 [Spirochaetes bacterium]|nr:hypothetical protein [Spirochaetota bacterium]